MGNRTVTVKSSGGTYTSLNSALATEDDTYADLVTNTMILTFQCYAFEDTTAADTGTGYTTSADYYINIDVPSAEMHDGTLGGYVIKPSGYYINGLTIQESYTRVNGVCVDMNDQVYDVGIIFNGADYIRISKCIVANVGGGSIYTGHGIYTGNGGHSRIFNCIMYDCEGAGLFFRDYAADTAYNCTAVDCGYGFYAWDYANSIAKNCLGYSNTTDFGAGGTLTCSYCASDDSTADNFNGTGNIVDIADPFVDFSGDDFHLASDAEILGDGTDSVESLFTDDIDGDTRSSWDIGADEYVAAGGGIPRRNPFSRPFSGPLGGPL